MEYILGPPSSDLIFIKTLMDNSISLINPTLVDPLGKNILQLNPNSSTPAYVYNPFHSLLMEEVNSPLPSASIVSAGMA